MALEKFMSAQEDDSFMQLKDIQWGRSSSIDVTDNDGQKVLKLKKEFKGCGGCCWFADSCNCAFVMNVELPSGALIGVVKQAQTACNPEYHILNGDNEPILYIEGPGTCCCVCTPWAIFKVYTMDRKDTIGSIDRLFDDIIFEISAEDDLYGISFPVDLDVKAKATLIGAAFMIECMHFHSPKGDLSK